MFSFLSNRRLRVVLDGTSLQEYPVNAGVPQGAIDQASDLWQQLELASQLESDLRDWGKKWLVDFHAGKTQLV